MDETVTPVQKLNNRAATPRPTIKKANKAEVQIPGQTTQGAQNNEGTEESADGKDKSKTVFNLYENEMEVTSWPGELSDSKIQFETKAHVRINDENFKTHLKRRGQKYSGTNERGWRRYEKQYAIGDRV